MYGRTRDGLSYTRFYGGYETTDGRMIQHDKNVCVRCERNLPDAKQYPHPMMDAR